MSQTLWNKSNYIRREYKYIRKTFISEYDINSAGMNVLFHLDLINENTYNYLSKLEKLNRNILIGNLLVKKPEYNKMMTDEFKRVIKVFMEINNIDDNDILSIKKDSIVLLSKIPKCLSIDNYTFKLKEKYNYFLLLDKNKEFYYNSNNMTYEIKGLSTKVLDKLEDTFFNFIFTCMMIDNENDENELYNHIKTFRSDYLNYRLPKEYYYSIIDEGYKLKNNDTLIFKDISEKDKENLNIWDNYQYLLQIIQLFLLKHKI